MTILKEKVVHLHYTLKNSAGEVLDSSKGQEPLAYIHGRGNLIPGLEKALEGKKTGDKINAIIPPEEAYGMKNLDFIQKVPLSKLPDSDQIKEGVQFQVELPDGIRIATVTKVENGEATLDMNHPLADQTLHFDVEVGEIRTATADELAHGHVHGAGGHHH